MNDFYTPLPNIKIDIERLTKEIFHYWHPDPNIKDISASFTTAKKYVDDPICDFSRYKGISHYVPGTRRVKVYSDGEFDQNLTHWPKILENTYMKELGDNFAKLLNVTRYRVRASYYNSLHEDFVGELHRDPHTPYRIHIALKTDPNVKWLLVDKNDNAHYIHQPADGHPVLLETCYTKHQVIVPTNSIRIHCWFQYYTEIDQSLLDNLLTA